MRAASPQTVDRVLGVLVAVCASAVLVAIGARAGPSITTLLRLTCCERCSSSSSRNNSRNSSSSKHKNRRSRRQRGHTQDGTAAASSSSSNGDDSDHREHDEQQDGEHDDDDDGGGGDAYHAYAYGSRSGTATAASAAAAAAAAAAVRNQRGARAGAGGGTGAGAGGGGSVLHVGGCHCGGLAFEVEAPEHLVAIEGPSKVRYPFITVPAEHFRLTSDDSNGSLYLLKCRPPTGRDSTPKVSAHFFCRRCGVHVVHAPDFPHAAVADVNVHCIRPATIKSLAVAFLRGGGAELPGMGDPVEGVFEVGRESWSDAMRERVSVALQQQPFGQTSATSSSRALSPRRRSASVASANNIGAGTENTTTARGLHSGGVRGRRGEGIGASFVGGEMMAPSFGAGSGRGAPPDVSTLRRNAEERERARQQAESSSSRRPPSAGGSARGGPSAAGNSWGDVLMHVASLPSSSSAAAAGSIRQHKARSNSSASATGNANADGNGVAWRGGASEGVRHAERGRHLAGSSGGSSGGGGGEGVGGELSPTDASGKVASGVGGGGGGGDGGVEVGAAGSRQRRSMSVDSSSLPHSTISSPGAEGVTSGDGVEEASGGGRSPAGGGGEANDNGSRNGGGGGGGGGGDKENSVARGGLRASAAGGNKHGGGGGAGYRSSVEEERDLFVRPPPSGGVSGGYAAAQA